MIDRLSCDRLSIIHYTESTIQNITYCITYIITYCITYFFRLSPGTIAAVAGTVGELRELLDVFGADLVFNLLFRQKSKLQNVYKRLYYAICIGVYLHLLSNY